MEWKFYGRTAWSLEGPEAWELVEASWLSAVLSQQENTPAVMQLTMTHTAWQEWRLRGLTSMMLVAYPGDEGPQDAPPEATVVFRGQILPIPSLIHDNIIQLTCTAQPPYAEALSAAFIAEKTQDPLAWDPLLTPPDKSLTPWDVCAATWDVPYWRPSDGALLTSGFWRGNQSVDIQPYVLAEGCHWQLTEPPITHLTLHLRANWVQQASGQIGLGNLIGLMETYTPEAFQAKWWPEGTTLQSGRYTLVHSYLTLVQDTKGDVPAVVEPKLDVAWSYQQPRQETATLSVQAAVSTMLPRSVELLWTLGDITTEPGLKLWQADHIYRPGDRVIVSGKIYKCQEAHVSGLCFWDQERLWKRKKKARAPLPTPDLASFFTTQRGCAVLRHSAARARVLLGQSLRSGRLSCQVPLNVGWRMGGAHTVQVAPLWGKVVGYTHTLMSATKGPITELQIATSCSVDPATVNPSDGVWVPVTIAPETLQMEGPPPGLPSAAAVTPHRLLEQKVLVNDAHEQRPYHDAKSKCPITRLTLRLMDLRTYPCLEHAVTVPEVGLYTPPTIPLL